MERREFCAEFKLGVALEVVERSRAIVDVARDDVLEPPPLQITEYQRLSKLCRACGMVSTAGGTMRRYRPPMPRPSWHGPRRCGSDPRSASGRRC